MAKRTKKKAAAKPKEDGLAARLRSAPSLVPWPDAAPKIPQDYGAGWFMVNELGAIARPFLGDETRLVVELGSYTGQSTRFWLQSAPEACVVAVDWWRSDHHINPRGTSPGDQQRLLNLFIVNNFEYRDRLFMLRTLTTEGLRELHKVLEPGLLFQPDLIVVDACHEYEAVLCELKVALHLWPETPIVGDDWWSCFPGVGLAVQKAHKEFAPERRLEQIGRAWGLFPK